MKKYISFLFVLVITGILNVNAASNPYKQSGPYGTNCTWYAWKMAEEKAGVTLPGWGNAKDWFNDAKNAGYNVGTTPASNSIIVWGDWTSYGHVGYVASVEGDILHVWDSTGPCIDEQDPTYIECMANGVSEESDKACKAAAPRVACQYSISNSQYNITGYIYLNDAPKTTPANSSTTTKKKETKKSNNANLSTIEISNETIEFSKDILEYEIEVENELNNITIKATTEHEKAVIEGAGDYKLNVGLNEIKLTVTAEDKSTKEYTIKVTRKEKEVVNKEVSETNTKKEEKSKKIDNKKIIILISSVCVLIVLIFNLKKKKK